MLKKTIKYKDYNDEEVEEDFEFNINESELIELEVSVKGGLGDALQEIVKTEDGGKIIEQFKRIILKAYGVRSEDGKRFVKNQQLRDEFESSQAYNALFLELVTDADAAAQFINGIIPTNLDSHPRLKAVADIQEKARAAAPEPEIVQSGETPSIKEYSRDELVRMEHDEYAATLREVSAGRARLI